MGLGLFFGYLFKTGQRNNWSPMALDIGFSKTKMSKAILLHTNIITSKGL